MPTILNIQNSKFVAGIFGILFLLCSSSLAQDQNRLNPQRDAKNSAIDTISRVSTPALANVNLTDSDQKKRYNIVFIMIDDLGWMDLACQGNKLVETPNIDKFARQGMRFTSAYAAAPVCSPTRAAVMTGQSPARLRITNHTPDQERFTPDNPKLLPADMFNELASDHLTIAEVLKANGYSTAFMGKWHLSSPRRGKKELEPTMQGFDINIGGCGFGGPPTFFDPYRIPNLPNRKEGEYLPFRLADEASSFLKKQKSDANADKPFALFLWPYTVHWPMEAPKELLKKYESRKGAGLNDTRYGAMIEAMDDAVGQVLDTITELGLDKETLVVFTSDNGGYGGVADNRPLRKDKGHLYEGGIRVPLIVRFPSVIEPNTTNDTPVVSMDFFLTLTDFAGIPTDPNWVVDGESITPLLTGKGKLKRDSIYFHYPNYAFHRSNRLGGAVRSGKYKLIENFDDDSLELYDLSTDLGEAKNIAEKFPDVAGSMKKGLVEWRASVKAAMPKPVENVK